MDWLPSCPTPPKNTDPLLGHIDGCPSTKLTVMRQL
jgi:hypothetical protein